MSPHAASFESRVAVLGPLAYRVAFRILGDRPEAQDLTQEALARAYSRWGRVADYDEAWISRVVTNLRWAKCVAVTGPVDECMRRPERRRSAPSSSSAPSW